MGQSMPFGLQGGESGRAGGNIRVKLDGSRVELGGADACDAEAFEELIAMTPGAGGHGRADGQAEPGEDG